MTVGVIALLKRRPDITHEQFIERWAKNHTKILASLNVTKRNIIRYSQLHVDLQYTETLKQAGRPAADFDGVDEMEVDKLDDLLDIFTDEGYLQIVAGEPFVKFERDA
ncbi:hypothetical protein M422DRAFT_38253 [Sphaerobolus stellatus SS14]|uniref:EthD domain-containing protein n=1 Tax=Sphaerobolus stellatus (strain SS14) TaxID=990650 RepID=A0A0C9ULT2_SPHS4|nr:hypothetical protein M422DRAFT_38253 [Sphaerobolus stellatus SS14]